MTKKVFPTAVVCCVSVVLIGMMHKIPGLTFEETPAYTTKDTPEAVITVGIIKDGQTSYK